MGRGGTNPGNCGIAVRTPHGNSLVLIKGIRTPSTRGHSESLKIFSKRQSMSPSFSRNTQIFDASIDRKLANDGDSTSIFSKVIGPELSHSTSADLYLRCRMDLTSNAVVTEAPNLVNLGLPAIITSDEFNTFGTPATRIRRPTYGPYWSAPDHIFW